MSSPGEESVLPKNRTQSPPPGLTSKPGPLASESRALTMAPLCLSLMIQEAHSIIILINMILLNEPNNVFEVHTI